MQTEMQKRIEARCKLEWIERGYKDDTFFNDPYLPTAIAAKKKTMAFEDAFQAGAKFILEMPELRNVLDFYAGNYLDGCKCSHEITCYLCRDYESLKKAGLCE